jgi:hypothetical protein
MNKLNIFNYGHFLSLTGYELVKYVEPFLTMQREAIPESVYEPLQSTLAHMDNEHALYALEMCMLLKPSAFARRLITFLSHSDAAVCTTAYRLINGLSPDLMPADLVAKIVATPTVDLFAPDVRTGDRIRIGTNEVFIRDLVAKWDQQAHEAT